MPSTAISTGAPAASSPTSLPPRRSPSPSPSVRAAVRPTPPCPGCTGSRPTCFGAAGGPSDGNFGPTAEVESTAGPTTRTRPTHASTAPRTGLDWHVLSPRCGRSSDALLLYALADLTYEEIAFALDVPIGTGGRGSTERARWRNASSRRRPTLSLSRRQELIFDGRTGSLSRFSSRSCGSERRRAKARLDAAGGCRRR